MTRNSLDNPNYYIGRDLSWLKFNWRVLEEAFDETNPLLERVKFLAISASNLDEFFEVRIASLLQRLEDGEHEPGIDGLMPEELCTQLAAETQKFARAQYRCWNDELQPALSVQGIRVLRISDLEGPARIFVEDYCERELDPLLTPVTVDPAHPFPRVINKAMCLALLLGRKRRSSGTYMGVVTVPRSLPRLVRVPSVDDSCQYVALSELVELHAATMYRGYEILSQGAFRITRNSNLYLQEEESRSLLESIRAELHNRRKGDAVRLEIDSAADSEIVQRLQTTFELQEWQVYKTDGPISLARLMHLYNETKRPDLKFRPFSPSDLRLTRKSANIFDEIRAHDILLHHPYDSYNGVVSFINSAADDPSVLSIKQSLYRTNDSSPVVEALVRAAERKEVAVVVEVKARFDEASNIRWARYLEDAGVQVFHGLVGLKTHCKLLLVSRKEEDGAIRRYAHLGTGNYNPATAGMYTDLSLMTADEEITGAVNNVFHFLTAYAEHSDYSPLLVAPLDLASHTLRLIGREAEHARNGEPARIIAKVNALLDRNVIQELYRASQAGVEIDLIVRGACSLRPGIRGLSSRIRVRSVVGRFLEHSRIFYFANGGNDEIYLGSADWMPRNLYERVEVVFPVRDAQLRTRVLTEILQAYLLDNAKTRSMQRDGTYTHARASGHGSKPAFSAQQYLIDVAEGRAPLDPAEAAPQQRTRAATATR